MSTTNELQMGYGEEKDADLWIKIWEDLYRLAARDIVVEVEHVKSHRTKKDKEEVSQFEKFVAEEARAKTAVCSQLSLSGRGMEDCEELKPKPKDKWIFVDRK